MFLEGSYLVAYAHGAAPSDEAQFTSCSIGCSSSPITVRAKHWQSNSVLLQVCLRDSFPNNVEHNPLLHCQELPRPRGNELMMTEVVLPKTSLVDVRSSHPLFLFLPFRLSSLLLTSLPRLETSPFWKILRSHTTTEDPNARARLETLLFINFVPFQDEEDLQPVASHKQVIESSKHEEVALPDKITEPEGLAKGFGGEQTGEEETSEGFENGEAESENGRGEGSEILSGGERRSHGGEFGGQEGESEVKVVSGKDRFGEKGFQVNCPDLLFLSFSSGWSQSFWKEGLFCCRRS